MHEREVLVIGAGLAGLSAALRLMDAGRDVALLDAGPEPGGLARADRVGEHAFARGPQSFLGSSRALGWLCARTGCEGSLIPARAATRRWVFRGGRLHELPSSPLSFAASSLLGVGAKLRLLAEPFLRSQPHADDESVIDFFRRRLGRGATDAFVVPFVSGVHAGNADTLEARSAFRRFWDWERARGSLVIGALLEPKQDRPKRRGIWSFAGGLQVLPDAAARELGARLSLREPVEALERDGSSWRVHAASGSMRARRIILAVPPPAAAVLLRRASETASRACAEVRMAPVAVIHLGGPVEGSRPEGFGVLMHRDEGMEVLGIVLSSSLFPGLAPEGHWLQSSYVGGSLHPRALERSDDELCALARDATRRVFGFDPLAGVRRVVRHPAGIPQLEQGHARRIASLRAECARLGGISLAGSWLDGIGLEAAAASGLAAADGLLEEAA